MAVNPELRELVARVRSLEKSRLQQKQPTLGHSSVEDGSLVIREDDVVRQVIGRQPDGSVTTIDLNATAGPIPEPPVVATSPGFLVVSSYGLPDGQQDWPVDFLRIEIHVSATPDFTPSPATKLGEFTADGGQSAFALVPGTYYVVLMSRNTSGVLSEPTEEVEGTVVALEVEAPTEAPESSPAITSLTGIPMAMVARVETVAASQEIEYHVWSDAIGDETYVPTEGDADTMFATTRSAVQIIDRLPNGDALAEGTLYYAATFAKNSIGYADDPSAVVVGQIDMAGVRNLVLAELVAGFILTGRIEVGSMTLDADEGLVFRDEDGNPFITLPVDGAATADIYAYIRASGITIEDNANLYGLAQEFGTFRLANGIPDPSEGAAMSRTWDNLETFIWSAGFTHYRFGYCENPAGDRGVTSFAIVGSTAIERFDLTTGDQTGSTPLADMSGIGGITRVGTDYFVLGQSPSRSYAWYIYKLDSTFAKTGEWAIGLSAFAGLPAIGTDGTDVLMAWTHGDGDAFRVRSWNTSGTLQGNVDLTHNLGNTYTCSGVYLGAADIGSSRYVIVPLTGNPMVFNTSGVRQTGEEFLRAGAASPHGFWWDGDRFKSLDDSGRVWDYADGHPFSSTWYGGYTWYDADTSSGSSTHETAVSTAQPYLWPARSRVVIGGQAAPDAGVTDPTKLDKANLIRIWFGFAAHLMRLQDGGGTDGALPVGVTSLPLDNPDLGSAIAPTSSDFGSVPGAGVGNWETGALHSDGDPMSFVMGTGEGRVGPNQFNDTGRVPHGQWATVTNQTIGNAAAVSFVTRTGWATIDTDSGAYGIAHSGGAFTVTEAGHYDIFFTLAFAANATASRRIGRVTLDGTEVYRDERYQGSASTATSVGGSFPLWVPAGGVIRFELWQNTGGDLGTPTTPARVTQAAIHRRSV